MLTIQNIHYRIAPGLSLNDISFEAQAGEVVIILGANGAGKSTLLKVITGSIKAGKGTIRMGDTALEAMTAAERAAISAVLQQQNPLQLPFSVYDVVMMGRYPHFKKHAAANDESVVAEMLERTGIMHLKERNYLTLSGGEQQRVHLARVLAQVGDKGSNAVRYLFMDEPSNNLDIRHQHTALTIARDFAQKGNCVIAVLHDLNLALQYADKILLLKNGGLHGFGVPAEVMTDHAISDVYGLPLQIFHHPSYRHPIVMPAAHNIINN
jgi:iron complex transport system ATP-binding protein